jgi:hypothetical protein
MTPADGSDFHHSLPTARALSAPEAVLLHGGRALLLIEACDTPFPLTGHLQQDRRRSLWTAESWPVEAAGGTRWHGVAVLEEVPGPGAEITGAAGGGRWRLDSAPRMDVAPDALANLVRRAGIDGRGVFAFLMRHLLAGRPRDSAEARAYRAFARAFIDAAAERDGFVELVAVPETGGFFAQGWSRSLPSGPALVADAAEDLTLREIEVAHFGRDDLLAPARGFCFFGKAWRDDRLDEVDAVFFESDGRLLRLDVVETASQLSGEAATTHVRQMLPRLAAPEPTLGAFKRICRPRFSGEDTLSGTSAPIAAALDMLLEAPDGTLLAIGWLLDPLRRVERVFVKNTASLYGQLDAGWCRLPRPDLIRGFAADPRFANLLDESEDMHGFVARIPASPDQPGQAQVYLELLLEDGGCLFRPVPVTPFRSVALLPNILRALPSDQPEMEAIVRDHLAPFLASVRPGQPAEARDEARPIPLGDPAGAREVSALMPVPDWHRLQTVLALLAGTPEAGSLELVLVAPRALASSGLAQIRDAFAFYGLAGRMVVARDADGHFARLDLAVRAAPAPRLLAWAPSVLPKWPGWLQRLQAEYAALPAPGLLSPALVYEDGSIAFGGAASDGPSGLCGLSGYGAERLHRGSPRQAPSGAPQIGLVDRDVLAAAGGFAGATFSDAFAHLDLASRLRAAGADTWCSGQVAFWCLDDEAADPAAAQSVLRRIDAALIERRAGAACGRGIA